MLLETLVKEFLTVLKTTGRDWHRVRTAIRGLEYNVLREAHGEPWSAELRLYLTDRVCEALTMARDEAVALAVIRSGSVPTWRHPGSVRVCPPYG
mgnify:CR=1 FL=1